MLNPSNNARGGFTLIEVMIVVAIIALLAVIALPNFQRARKRSQATAVLEDLRLVDSAKGQYAIENSVPVGGELTCGQLAPYVRQGSRLYNVLQNSGSLATFTDFLGTNLIAIGVVDTPPLISEVTRDNFSDVIENPIAFWGSYAP